MKVTGLGIKTEEVITQLRSISKVSSVNLAHLTSAQILRDGFDLKLEPMAINIVIGARSIKIDKPIL